MNSAPNTCWRREEAIVRSLKRFDSSYLPNPPTPVPSQPFPFLKLPREIRDLIYDYALLHPRNSPSIYHPHICYFRPKRPANSVSKSSTPYWGTEASTRLFLVNHQISNEALELFYKTYAFHFPHSATVSFVNATLRDTLSPWARSLITRIGFWFCLPYKPHSCTSKTEEAARRAIEAVVDLLPNIQWVVLRLAFVGCDLPEYQIREIVARVLKMVGPLRGIADMSLDYFHGEGAQRTRILEEVREALGCQ